jgi:hypothetical protein
MCAWVPQIKIFGISSISSKTEKSLLNCTDLLFWSRKIAVELYRKSKHVGNSRFEQ